MTYVPKSQREKETETKGDIVKIEDGLFLVIQGHPPSGEKAKIIWYTFNEEGAKDIAIAKGAYVYQLIYSTRKMGTENPCGTKA